jgi:hypothetical protein
VGYARELLKDGYQFADYLGPEQTVQTVPLVAFGEEPPSYRSACVALQFVQTDLADEAGRAVARIRGLGASRIITVGARQARLWRLGASPNPVLEEETSPAQLARVIRIRADRWSPESILRARGVGPVDGHQLDFSDVGLMQVIEAQVHQKLDRLLREVLDRCFNAGESRSEFRDVVRFVFWLVTAKVLIDRGHSIARGDFESVQDVLELAGSHYGIRPNTEGAPQLPARAPRLAQSAWETVRGGLLFQNLSVDALALVYEGTLVHPETRQRLGIHATPRWIAEMVVEHLPIEELRGPRDGVLELCAGFGPFLVAALRRLRQNRGDTAEPLARHSELVRRFHAVELDAFAIEMARLSLTLADYPNSNGWRVESDDVFAKGVVERAVAQAGVVFSNPPFERFTPAERKKYGASADHKSTELLRLVLDDSPPQMLGLVLPASFIRSQRGIERGLRARLAQLYREVDTVDVPDSAFAHSDVESVLLVARGHRAGPQVLLRTGNALQDGNAQWRRSEWSHATRAVDNVIAEGDLRVGALDEVWRRLARLNRLEAVADVHQGIQYRRSLASARQDLISTKKRSGMARGLESAEQLAPFKVLDTTHLSIEENELRFPVRLDWKSPKVLLNAARRSRGPWCVTAAVDLEGLIAYQRLHGVWTREPRLVPLELLAAILNGPVANAWIHERAGKRDIQVGLVRSIPMPNVRSLDIQRLVSLVRDAASTVAVPEAWLQIDAEVLKGYGLPPRMERRLLRSFDGVDRFGVRNFHYYPDQFESTLPLHALLELDDSSTAGALLPRLPVVDDPEVSEVFGEMAAGFDE